VSRISVITDDESLEYAAFGKLEDFDAQLTQCCRTDIKGYAQCETYGSNTDVYSRLL